MSVTSRIQSGQHIAKLSASHTEVLALVLTKSDRFVEIAAPEKPGKKDGAAGPVDAGHRPTPRRGYWNHSMMLAAARRSTGFCAPGQSDPVEHASTLAPTLRAFVLPGHRHQQPGDNPDTASEKRNQKMQDVVRTVVNGSDISFAVVAVAADDACHEIALFARPPPW